MKYPTFYEIRVEGQLTDRLSDWFDGLAIWHDKEGETTLRGWFVDQAALYGVLVRLHSLNLGLLSVVRLPPES